MFHWIITLQARMHGGSIGLMTQNGTSDILAPDERFTRVLDEVRKLNPAFKQSVVMFYSVEKMP